jgi:hypothetical protein
LVTSILLNNPPSVASLLHRCDTLAHLASSAGVKYDRIRKITSVDSRENRSSILITSTESPDASLTKDEEDDDVSKLSTVAVETREEEDPKEPREDEEKEGARSARRSPLWSPPSMSDSSSRRSAVNEAGREAEDEEADRDEDDDEEEEESASLELLALLALAKADKRRIFSLMSCNWASWSAPPAAAAAASAASGL